MSDAIDLRLLAEQIQQLVARVDAMTAVLGDLIGVLNLMAKQSNGEQINVLVQQVNTLIEQRREETDAGRSLPH